MRTALALVGSLLLFTPLLARAQEPAAAEEAAEAPEEAEGAPTPEPGAEGAPDNAGGEAAGAGEPGGVVEAVAVAAVAPEGEPAVAEAAFDPKAYAEELRRRLPGLREKIEEKIGEKITAKQEAQMDMISEILGYVSLAGFLLLLLPLFLGGRYPGKAGVLFKQAALAGLLFCLAVNMLSLALMLLRGMQGAMAAVSNPQIAMVEGFFDTLDKDADDLAAIGPQILDPTLAQLEGGGDSAAVALLDNLHRLQQQVGVFQTVADWLKGLDWLFGALPTVMALVAVGLFVVSFRPLLTDIVMLPIRAAKGEVQLGAGALAKETMRKVGREFLVVFGMMGVLIVLTIVSGTLLSLLVAPAVEALLGFLLIAFIYLQVEPVASTGLLLVSIASVLALLVMCVLVVVVGNVLFLSRAQKIFRQRYHDKIPLGRHRVFWTRGSWQVLWSQLLPVLILSLLAVVVEPVLGAFIDGDEPSFLAGMLASGAVLLFGFVALFWLGRGVRSLKGLASYKVVDAAKAG